MPAFSDTLFGTVSNGETSIYKDITIINADAYKADNSLAEVKLQEIKSIGERAFMNCTSLIKVDMSDSLPTEIGESAFEGCTGLTSIAIPDSVTEIGEWAFCDCTGLTNVVIGNSVKIIGNDAFDGCTNLKAIIVPERMTDHFKNLLPKELHHLIVEKRSDRH